MKAINKIMFTLHLLKQRYYEALLNDCLCPSLRSKLIIKATYHRKLAQEYLDTFVPRQSIG